MNNDNFLIESSDLENVKELCSCIKDADKRKRAVINMLAANISKKYFTDIELDNTTNLHEIPLVLEDLDIADIYIKNNYIDVRLYFENELPNIPVSHLKKDFMPVAYMFIKVDNKLSSATVTGFAISSTLNMDVSSDYITISENELVSYYDLENNLSYNNDEIIYLDNNLELDIFNYLDGIIKDNNCFYEKLIKSPEGREKLKNTAIAKLLLTQIPSALQNFNDNNELNINEENDDDNEEKINLNFNKNENDYNTELNDESELISFESFEYEKTEQLELSEDIADLEIQELENLEDDNLNEDIITLEINDYNDAQEQLEESSLNDINNDFELADYALEDKNNEAIDNFEIVDNNATENISINSNEHSELDSTDNIPEEKNIVLDDDINQSYETNNDNFSTSTTPSLNSIEESIEFDRIKEDELIKELEREPEIIEANTNSLEEDNEEEEEEEKEEDDDDSLDEVVVEETENNNNSDEIDNLFNEENISSTENYSEPDYNDGFTPRTENKQKSISVKFISFLALLIALGYFGYTKYTNIKQPETYTKETKLINTSNNNNVNNIASDSIPMPNETVENIKDVTQTEEAINETIPVIENSLDTSILVSNLSIKWEVPSAYLSNSTAKRYFTKLGKILQLNLKTELLLLNKPPITNKICVELEFNNNTNKFEPKNIIVSSGEKFIDDVIFNTVKSTLNINLNMNINVFKNITGNPVLVIHL